jgi:hypothetical protein
VTGRRGYRGGDGWHPGTAGERVAQRSQDVNAVLGGGGQVAVDRVPVPGGLLGAESAGDFLLGFGRAQVAFCVVGGGRDAQVASEPQHVIAAVAEAFEQVAPRAQQLPRRPPRD